MKRQFFFVCLFLLIIGLSGGVAAAQNSHSLWFVSYYDNPDLEGTPVASASTGVIDFDWGHGPPSPGLPADNWSATWTSIVEFSAGTYRFTTRSDDGVRVFLGDKHIISDWNDHPELANNVMVSLLGGSYSMAVDFYDHTGQASLRLNWERIGPAVSGAPDVTVVPNPAPPAAPPPSYSAAWQASYWNNISLFGEAALTRTESGINDNWGSGSPAPGVIGTDLFSARWTRSVYFPAGTYRFTTESDDGIRVFIGGNKIIDNWTIHALQRNTVEVTLAAGTYPVVVEYFENNRLAVARFWWEVSSGESVGNAGVIATTRPFWLNMRAGPGVGYQVLDVLPLGTAVQVVGRTSTSRWIQVTYQGVTGWLSAPYTTISGNLDSVSVTG